VVVDVAPYFGHPEADLALVDIYAPVDPALLRAYAELAPLDPGFAGRHELWRLAGYLAAIAVDGASAADGADEVILLGVAVHQSRQRVRPAQVRQLRHDPSHAQGQIGRKISRVNGEAQHWQHPPLA
jgi:hypothetical protein